MNELDLRPILLVEDDEVDAELTVLGLRKYLLKNAVIHVTDGAIALDFLFCRGAYQQRPQANPCLVLLDLKLPKIDGLSVLKAIRADARTRAIPVFVLTASSAQQDMAEATRLQITDYLVKPVEFVSFASVVAKAGLNWGLFAQEGSAQ